MDEAVVFIPAKSEHGLKHYGYDDLGYCTKVRDKWCANIFKADYNEELRFIGFQTISNNTTYSIYIYDLGTEIPSSPVNGTVIESIIDGYAQYTGYHTVEAQGNIPEGHYFSVVINSDKGLAGEGIIRWTSGNLYADPVCNPGESYSSYNGSYWRERSNNVCIKAFTVIDDSCTDLKLIEISSKNFPDKILRSYICEFDLDDNGYLSSHELEIIQSINLPDSGLHSMEGIQLLTNIVSIDISGNCLNAIDLSGNHELKYLKCTGQDISGMVITEYGDGLYSVNLKSFISGDIGRVIHESVRVSSGEARYDSESGAVTFSTLPSWVRYEYDTGFNGIAMDVTAHTVYEGEEFVNIDGINFTDSAFRDFVRQYDTDNDGWLSLSERSCVSKIILNGDGKISSLKGIEFFMNLEELDCHHLNLSQLDISKNTKLTGLYCHNNSITSLNVRNNVNLTELLCYRNQLSSLDVDSNSALKILHCSDNPIKSLNLRNNVNLVKLYVYGCELDTLDLANNVMLDTLFCQQNNLKELDISNLSNLKSSLGYGAGYVEYDSQAVSGLKASYGGGKFLVNLHDYVSNISRINPDTVRDISGKACTYDKDSGIATFAVKPEGLYYQYDTGYTKLEAYEEGYRYMDVTVSAGESPELLALTMPFPNAFVNAGYEADIAVICSKPASLEIVSGDFPDGLFMDDDGRISGTPSTSGVFSFTVRAWNDYGYDLKSFSLKINKRRNFRITPNSLSNTTWGKKYAKRLKVSGLKSPLWTVSGDIPDGLSLNSSTGKISGVAKGVGTFSFTAKAFKGITVSKDYTFKVMGVNPKLKGSLSKGIVGNEYYAELTASGTTPIAWSIPNLPKGLGLTVSDDGKLCIISGIPTEGYKRKVSVTLSNAAGSLTRNISLRVKITKPKITH